jgi:hypothetical protein
MHYYIYRDAEKAKAEMMPLFALKSNLKSHISIWKPGFERYVLINVVNKLIQGQVNHVYARYLGLENTLNTHINTLCS